MVRVWYGGVKNQLTRPTATTAATDAGQTPPDGRGGDHDQQVEQQHALDRQVVAERARSPTVSDRQADDGEERAEQLAAR